MLCPLILDNRNGLRIRGGGTFVGPVGPVGPVGRWACRQDQPHRQVTSAEITIGVKQHQPNTHGTAKYTGKLPEQNHPQGTPMPTQSHGQILLAPTDHCLYGLLFRLANQTRKPNQPSSPTPTAQQTAPAYCLSRFFLRRYTF